MSPLRGEEFTGRTTEEAIERGLRSLGRKRTAVQQKIEQPPGMAQHLWHKWNLRQRTAADHFFHAIAQVALAHPGHCRVDSDHQGGESRDPRSFDRSFGSPAPTHQI